MNEYIKLFNTHSDYETYINSQGKILPNVSYCEIEDELHYNPITMDYKYLTTIALEDGTITFSISKNISTKNLQEVDYSIDSGKTWVTTDNVDNKTQNLNITVNVNKDDKVLWRGIGNKLATTQGLMNTLYPSTFNSTCNIKVQGNIMSMLYGDDFLNKKEILLTYAFTGLFRNNSHLIDARDLSLPANDLNTRCYQSMFSECTSLTTAPKLPATNLAEYCYASMFYNCTSLTNAPELPATTLANNCYSGMFENCTSLATVPELPATTLADVCYLLMFANCTSLTETPELPATTLIEYCYAHMFEGCTSLTSTPELPATILATACYLSMFKDCTSLTTAPILPALELVLMCYQDMFNGCTSLNYIKAMFTTTPESTYTNNWVDGVVATGTFIKNSVANWDVTGVNGVPSGWTVQTASE